MAKIQCIKRRNSLVYSIYLPQEELDKSGLLKGEEVRIESKGQGVLHVYNPLKISSTTNISEITVNTQVIALDEESISKAITKLDSPVQVQKELASKIGIFLDQQMDKELSTIGSLSDLTRRWVEVYKDLLDNIHKNMYGDKSMNLQFHTKISHAQIGALMRKNIINDD